MLKYSGQEISHGFSLIELVTAILVLALIVVFAVPTFRESVNRSKITRAIGDIAEISARIDRFRINNDDENPANLAAIGMDRDDPWGLPYVYLDIGNGMPGMVRKNKNLVPINSDYDLYSAGPDKQSQPPLTASSSKDDIVRANNGGFIGLAEDY